MSKNLEQNGVSTEKPEFMLSSDELLTKIEVDAFWLFVALFREAGVMYTDAVENECLRFSRRIVSSAEHCYKPIQTIIEDDNSDVNVYAEMLEARLRKDFAA